MDGASLDNYEPDVLGHHIGYLPQRVQLFDGTIADNIARLDPNADPEKIVAAAKKAAAHDMILKLPEGYDTVVTTTGGRLSGGQIQRIGLARAMYDDPVFLVLDEPNSNLDNEGSNALNAAIRAMKAEEKSVIIMAHRPAAIEECDTLLVLENGTRVAFGPRTKSCVPSSKITPRLKNRQRRRCIMSAPTKQFSSLKPLLIGLFASILLIIGFGGWAVMAQLSGAIIASGQIEVDQNRQIVQHPDGGVVAEILVGEGDTVNNGDVLLRLDPRAEKSELSIIQGQLFELMARRGD